MPNPAWATVMRVVRALPGLCRGGEVYRMAAMQGDAKAQTSLGYCYESGEGAAQDNAEAVKWYRMAAAQGFPAQCGLGYCYGTGKGVAQDHAEAARLFRMFHPEGLPLPSSAWADVARRARASRRTMPNLRSGTSGLRAKVTRMRRTHSVSCIRAGRAWPRAIWRPSAWFRRRPGEGDWMAQFNLGRRYRMAGKSPRTLPRQEHGSRTPQPKDRMRPGRPWQALGNEEPVQGKTTFSPPRSESAD